MSFPSSAGPRAWLAAVVLVLTAGVAHAGPPAVEIVGYAHPPVQSALKPLRDWLGAQGSKVKVTEIDLDTPAGEKRLQALGIKGHVPVVVLVDGQYRHHRADGTTVEFLTGLTSRQSYTYVATAWNDCNGNGIFDAGIARESPISTAVSATAQVSPSSTPGPNGPVEYHWHWTGPLA